MKLGMLFSGGKDSCLALHKAQNDKQSKVVCLIAIVSENKESYMFHTPNIHITTRQAKSIGLPIILQETKGVKEKELSDLKSAIKKAIEKYHIEGIVTGAVESIYQSLRIQKICNELDIWCFNPLWQKDQIEILEELIKQNFKVIISGVFAYPLDKLWLGKIIDNNMITELKKLKESIGLNPAGEGGEIETTVIDGPMFSYPINIELKKTKYKNHAGVFELK